ncbi:MAG: DNA polymerase III subunit delta [Pirellulaceae bacterium]|nr:DNA polymerase III subunit delta [Pirellulaceae bacterium]
MAKQRTFHVLDYLQAPGALPSHGIGVLFGDDNYLKTEARKHLYASWFKDEEDEMNVMTFDNSARWADVHDEISSLSLFGSNDLRIARIENADTFVTEYRDRLEDLAARKNPRGLLLLEVKTWAANTRLYKLVDQHGFQLECKVPLQKKGKNAIIDRTRVIKWLQFRAQQDHGLKMERDAGDVLLDLKGTKIGQLEQAVNKLSLYVEKGGTISSPLVEEMIGGWKFKTTWDVISAAADGNISEALGQVDQLIQAGEHPLGLLAQFSWSLRRFAMATRIYEASERKQQRISLGAALKQAGFHGGEASRAEKQLKRLGRERAANLFQWLLEADLGMKGSRSSRGHFILEHLFLKLATKSSAAPTRAS